MLSPWHVPGREKGPINAVSECPGEPPIYQQHSHIQDSGLASNSNNICSSHGRHVPGGSIHHLISPPSPPINSCLQVRIPTHTPSSRRFGSMPHGRGRARCPWDSSHAPGGLAGCEGCPCAREDWRNRQVLVRTMALKTEQKKPEKGVCGQVSRHLHAHRWEQEIITAAQTRHKPGRSARAF